MIYRLIWPENTRNAFCAHDWTLNSLDKVERRYHIHLFTLEFFVESVLFGTDFADISCNSETWSTTLRESVAAKLDTLDFSQHWSSALPDSGALYDWFPDSVDVMYACPWLENSTCEGHASTAT